MPSQGALSLALGRQESGYSASPSGQQKSLYEQAAQKELGADYPKIDTVAANGGAKPPLARW